MLVLSRRKGEKIVIGNEIVIEILSVGSEGVRIGITAPRTTSVHRHEVFSEIEAANQAAEEVVKRIESNAIEKLSTQFRNTKNDEKI